MKVNKTGRGFDLIQFDDDNGAHCSLQKSSSANKYKIWLGVDEVIPKVLVYGEGWKEITLPPDTLIAGRMHLTRDQVKALLPYLNNFVETGELSSVQNIDEIPWCIDAIQCHLRDKK